ncbi:uncharacterized protein LOC8263145 [Ricinus communis]|uniref:uncharacterized protein LOC8263145 n=1 Tax=Ricinus communis TaxID=3988 RepID=UPI0007729BE7|nr:uncharacterized protein LOC8263145 [Ricinus communis]XP_015579347.1 uncharacterized protein LOC8263145 [Ricinus communis]XP_015579349.1 uncharacterized protein LOC8263145 [Ricinus communis]XP_015579350.1 uncharacterized protein LOC8263145 [Ricinus communis]|eukprot:XP_015579346.1 uncharacterized protein LOC8263145 [Ricinus communis]
MGKSLADLRKIYSRATKNLKASKYPRPTSRFQEERTEKKMEGSSDITNNINSNNINNGNSSSNNNINSNNRRLPLSEVVSDCVKRWFKDTLKEAKAGDINMQVLVGQMYYSGYGIPRDAQKGKIWMTRASKTRSSVWRVSDKHPGYNASDSDSDELKCDS